MPNQAQIRRPRIINSPRIAWSFRQSNLPILLISVAVILVLCFVSVITIAIVYLNIFSEPPFNSNGRSSSHGISENIGKPENNALSNLQKLISEPTDILMPARELPMKTLKLTMHLTSYSCYGAFPLHLELNKDAVFGIKKCSLIPQKWHRQV